MKFSVLLFFILACSIAIAVEKGGTIWKRLEKLNSLSYQDYQEQVVAISEGLERYLSHQQKVCSGEFSRKILGERQEQKGAKLSPKERKLCLESLQEIQRRYIKISFDKREQFLKQAHRERMERLREQRREAMEALSIRRKGRRR